jgi:Fe-S-cluster-containing hydrogenase component 2
MPAIIGLMSMLDSLESAVLAVHRERCVSIRNRNAYCLRCVEVCASGAIAYHDNGFELDSSRCIGCGTCVTACPTCALEMRNPTDDDLVRRVGEVAVATDGHPILVCETAVNAAVKQTNKQRSGILGQRQKRAAFVCDTNRAYLLPCLGRVDESLLVSLAASGVDTVTLVCDSCDSCQHATGGTLMREVAQSARVLLEAFGSTMTIHIESKNLTLVPLTSTDKPQENNLSRRDLCGSLKDGSLRAGAAVKQDVNTPSEAREVFARLKVGSDGTLPHFIPSRRVRVSRCLERIGEPVVKRIETRNSGSVLIDTQRCNSCRMCAVFCSTGALSKTDEANFYGLTHRASRCVRCRLCEQICPQTAITINTSVPVEQFLDKKAVRYRMKEPRWTPNKPDSMFEKLQGMLGVDKEMRAL